MVRIDGSMGKKMRLVQRTGATTITITHHREGTMVVNRATRQIGQYDLYYYDFRPLFSGTYLISWNQAPAEDRWELLDVPDVDLRDLLQRMDAETPAARTG